MSDHMKPGEPETVELLRFLTREQVRPRSERRLWVAIGLLLLAPLCMVVAYFPWPATELLDKVVWVGFALGLLLLGGWQLDKSNKETSHSRDSDGVDQGSGKDATNRVRKPDLRQVK